MTVGAITEILRQSVLTILKIVAPILGTGLIVGLTVSILQTITSIQEQTLSFVPKLVAVLFAITLLSPWILTVMTEYATHLFQLISQVSR